MLFDLLGSPSIFIWDWSILLLMLMGSGIESLGREHTIVGD